MQTRSIEQARGGTESIAGIVVHHAHQRYKVKTVVDEVLEGGKIGCMGTNL